MSRWQWWIIVAGSLCLTFLALASIAGQKKNITIVWAEWDPAKYLRELSKGFTKETGIGVTVVEIPWAQFQDKVFTALAARDPNYDIIIGDSQWLGRGAERKHYVELTDWMKKNVPIKDIYEPALVAYGEYPKGSGRYWAVPAEADAVGFAYRKDLLEDPKEKAAFQKKYGRPLTIPKTWEELYQVAKFFTRPKRRLYGVAVYTGKQYDGVTMGFQQVMWSFGGDYGDPKTFQVEGYINGPDSVKALEFYVRLAKECMPPGSQNYYWSECLDAFKRGLVAMTMNYFAFFPGLLSEETNRYAKTTGFFMVPRGPKGHYISLGGQGLSVSAYSKNKDEALQYIKWFWQERVQREWARLGGFTCHKKVLNSPDFLKATPYNPVFRDSMKLLKDFWAVPEYAELLDSCQRHLNAAIVGAKKPKEALDAIAKEHTVIFRKAGRLKRQ
ncbi:MAG: sugar ABC transporter substrate-binding protein [Armatimonadetes bacterium]|nr:sugar ABC transporter substrate-binding protein [Armatimonadota bacterium]MDW8122445.1 sugar ABC transporter substrate-binding protein [Armatimonadota bacterium]